MGKSLSEKDLESVEKRLQEHAHGLTIRDLAGPTATEAERRAIHRRLNKLIKLARVRVVGGGRTTRYFALDQPTSPRPVLLHKRDAQLEAEGGLFVPISEDGHLLQKILARPTAERNPVGYNRDFLAAYQPNKTFFLSPRERKYLADVGATGMTVQPAGTYAKQILDRLLIDLSFHSSRLEGNTYSLLDTIALLEQGRSAEGKSAEDTQMILNHKDAIEFLVDAANDIGFNRHTVLNLHGLLSNNLLLDPEASGRLRRKTIGIGGSVYEPLQDPHQIEECFGEMLQKAANIEDPFEQSLFVSIQLPYLQPFDDVNKRVSRLAANIPFIRGNLSPLSFIDVPPPLYIQAMLAVYELNATELARDMFIWAYERSARRYAAIRQSLGEPDPFRLRYREQIRSIISRIIRGARGKADASKQIAAYAIESISEGDGPRFVDVAEAELVGLHEGNFARYRVRPSEFYAWKAAWES